MSEPVPQLGLLPTILRTGFLQLEDVSPVSVLRYVTMLRSISPDQKIQTTAHHHREALRHAFRNVEMLQEDVPPYRAWQKLAETHGRLPQALASRDPERVVSIESVNLAQMASAVGYALETAGVRWCLSGALACCAFGEPRPVADLDFLVKPDKEALPALVQRLGDAFWTNLSQLEQAMDEGTPGIVYHLATLTLIWLVPTRGELPTEALARRVKVEGSSCGRLWVQSCEDSVIHRLASWREAEANEEIYWREVAMLLAAQPGMDASYVDGWAQKLDLVDTLRECRAQAGMGGRS